MEALLLLPACESSWAPHASCSIQPPLSRISPAHLAASSSPRSRTASVAAAARSAAAAATSPRSRAASSSAPARICNVVLPAAASAAACSSSAVTRPLSAAHSSARAAFSVCALANASLAAWRDPEEEGGALSERDRAAAQQAARQRLS
jgi:hypothetical protein